MSSPTRFFSEPCTSLSEILDKHMALPQTETIPNNVWRHKQITLYVEKVKTNFKYVCELSYLISQNIEDLTLH